MRKHLPFYPLIIWSAISIGILGGFGSGAYLVFKLAFDQTFTINLAAIIQIHGHLQLLGWTGLFIIGVSLYKLPRLMSMPPLSTTTACAIVFPIISGLIFRLIFQILLAKEPTRQFFRQSIALSATLESLGILLFVFSILSKLIKYKASPSAYAAAAIKPFLLVSTLGWLSYAFINIGLGWLLLGSNLPILDPRYSAFINEIYLHLVLLPTCFAFSISIFPIFLRLRSPNWPVARLALFYCIATLVYLLGKSVAPYDMTSILTTLGTGLRATAICWLIFEIDLLRLRSPWYQKFRKNQDRENNPPRKGSADYGQFGNFQWLIYAAYIWLCLAVIHELLSLSGITIQSESISRHLYTLGFVTHLILGVAVRMVPGFLGQNRIAYPFLVQLSFVFIFIATLARTAPIIFSIVDQWIFRSIYGCSGILAILALCCLGINLFSTVSQVKCSIKEPPMI